MRTSLLISFLILLLSATTCFFSCSDDKGVDSVSFKAPGVYNGYYKYIDHWMEPGEEEYVQVDTVVFEFFGNGRFSMDMAESDNNQHFCVVDTGTFRFTGDSIYLEILVENLVPVICAPGKGPEGGFVHSVQGNFLVFDIADQDNFILKKIELIGR